jgi:ketosteroid isomerase-like protein
MKNPVERLWRALAVQDFKTAAAELHPDAVVEWPHTGERFSTRDAFLAVHAAIPGPWKLEVRRVITEGRDIASEVVVRSGEDTWYVASFFNLRDGRIAAAVEYWVTSESPAADEL